MEKRRFLIILLVVICSICSNILVIQAEEDCGALWNNDCDTWWKIRNATCAWRICTERVFRPETVDEIVPALRNNTYIDCGFPKDQCAPLNLNDAELRRDECILIYEERYNTQYWETFYDDPEKPTETNPGRARRKRALQSNLWPADSNGLVPIYYTYSASAAATPNLVTAINNAKAVYDAETCIRWTNEVPSTGNYVEITNDESSGCAANVGNSFRGQILNLAANCQTSGIASHEMGHSIGLVHQQSRTDRDTYVTVLSQNVQGGFLHNFDIETGSNFYGVPYDYASVMHYGSDFFSIDPDNLVTLVGNGDYHSMMGSGQAVNGLSFFDVKLLNLAYCSSLCTNALTQPCEHGGYQDPLNCNQCRCPEGFSGTYCNTVATSEASSACNPVSGEIVIESDVTETCVNSPNFPSPYGTEDVCNWHVITPTGAPASTQIIAQFDSTFNIPHFINSNNPDEELFKSCYGHVEVRYEGELDSRGPRFCSKLPGTNNDPITSTGSQMLIAFRGNGISRTGFRICFRLNEPLVTTTTTAPTTTTTTPTTTTTTPTTTTTTPTTTTTTTPTTTTTTPTTTTTTTPTTTTTTPTTTTTVPTTTTTVPTTTTTTPTTTTTTPTTTTTTQTTTTQTTTTTTPTTTSPATTPACPEVDPEDGNIGLRERDMGPGWALFNGIGMRGGHPVRGQMGPNECTNRCKVKGNCEAVTYNRRRRRCYIHLTVPPVAPWWVNHVANTNLRRHRAYQHCKVRIFPEFEMDPDCVVEE